MGKVERTNGGQSIRRRQFRVFGLAKARVKAEEIIKQDYAKQDYAWG